MALFSSDQVMYFAFFGTASKPSSYLRQSQPLRMESAFMRPKAYVITMYLTQPSPGRDHL